MTVTMQTLHVNLADRSYPIHIGAGLLQESDLIIQHLPRKQVAIVSNVTVAPLYLSYVSESLRAKGIKVTEIILPDGEIHKNANTLDHIYTALLNAKCERNTTLIALGGGVIGDLTGYAAATFLRGVPFIQIPTTLLSQVDSSVGGKTGINHALGKNMIGAFYQPQVVIADTATLKTLPARELSAGMAEVIKYGLIRDAEFFSWLEINTEKLIQLDEAAITESIYRSCANKAAVVAADEKENGERALLNLGHTFGHAIENAMGYGNWLHGEAVAAGTMMAASLSFLSGWLSASDLARMRQVFEICALPIYGPKLDDDVNANVEKYLALMQLDKKVQDGNIRLILQTAIGTAIQTSDYDKELLEQVLAACDPSSSYGGN